MNNITFSSDTKIITLKEILETKRLGESYFKTKIDPDQFPATNKSAEWTYKKIQNFINIIKYKNKIIGFTFIIPSNKKLMKYFISNKITERELYEKSKKLKLNFETLYLCAAFINKEFRRESLALKAFIKTIKNNSNKNTFLFYWAYSKEGEKLAKKIGKITKLKILKRKS